MMRVSHRWALWIKWMRRQDLIGALMAIMFAIFLMGIGLYAVTTLHGFHLAGG